MAVVPGTRIGPYEVVSLLGSGGMGEVYRARDSKLEREVAIKVLPETFASDADRLARFEREAKTLAALNHPHIAQIYGLEDIGTGGRALVMELVEGDDLSQRIAKGPLPITDALPIAKQIAEALEAAHEQGIIHRDLKPANIKVREDGTVKVLDFGLAKLAEPGEAGRAGLSQSPTITTPAMTQMGMILGTAAYMSPEQARGLQADHRSDVFSFGCVLYEMLTGRRAFDGRDVGETLAFVITREPDVTALGSAVPTRLRTLISRCLTKDRRERLQAIGEARIAIDNMRSSGLREEVPVVQTPRSPSRLAWTMAAVAALAAASLGGLAFRRTASTEQAVVRTFVPPPEGHDYFMSAGIGGPAQISPDGRRLVFGAIATDGRTQLWVRSLDALAAQALPGTDGATAPFWSPDSKSIGFFADLKLKKILASGGPPQTLCDVGFKAGSSGTWNEAGVIVFSANDQLRRVSADGRDCVSVAPPGKGATVVSGGRPSFLPDGIHYLYRAESSGGKPFVGSLDDPTHPRQLDIVTDSQAVFSQGYLLFTRENTLMAQAFDPARLAMGGGAIVLAANVQRAGTTSLVFSVSKTGMLVHGEGDAQGGPPWAWFDRSGMQTEVLPNTEGLISPHISPDGQTVVGQRGTDVWTYELSRALLRRFTFTDRIEREARWSPDGRTIVFNSNRTKAARDLYGKPASAGGAETLLYADEHDKSARTFSPDGKVLFFRSGDVVAGKWDIWVLPMTGERKPFPYTTTSEFSEDQPDVSPDSRWVAYQSDESGRTEVYLAPYPCPGTTCARQQVSANGGQMPKWRRDGRELFFIGPDNDLMAVDVTIKSDSVEIGATRPLFGPVPMSLSARYDVSADGRRFLMLARQGSSAPLVLVQNWTAGLGK